MQFSNPEQPGYVGFANLPNQVHRKSVKKGFEFTLMVIGKFHTRTTKYTGRQKNMTKSSEMQMHCSESIFDADYKSVIMFAVSRIVFEL